MRAVLETLVTNLQKIAPTIWLTDSRNPNARNRVFEPGIKVQTIHSAKGLQYQAVILMWADQLPRPKYFRNAKELEDRRLFYVGLTRAEDFLVVSASGYSKFIAEIENSGKTQQKF